MSYYNQNFDLVFNDNSFKPDDLQSRFLKLLVKFFQENLTFSKEIELSGNVECKIDNGTIIQIEIPRILAQVLESHQDSGAEDAILSDFDSEYEPPNYSHRVGVGKGSAAATLATIKKPKTKKSPLSSAFANTIHRNTEKNHQCKECNFVCRKNSTLQNHINSVHLKLTPYHCDQCDKKFGMVQYLKCHKLRVHEKIRKFKCSMCIHSAVTLDDLNRHIDAVHFKLKKFNCSLCSYSCTQKYALNAHVKRKHERVKRFKCGACKFSSYHKYTVEVHKRRVHEKNLTVQCDQCGFEVWTERGLKEHIEQVHSKQSRKPNIPDPHLCNVCDLIFKSNDELRSHINLAHLEGGDGQTLKGDDNHTKKAGDDKTNDEHYKYSCKLCDYRGNNTRAFKAHSISVHKNKLPFQCSECDYMSSTVLDIDLHLKELHKLTPQRPPKIDGFKCDECDFIGTDIPKLRKHVIISHVI